MRSRNVLFVAGVAALASAALPLTASHAAGVFRLRRLVVVGDSVLAGFGNGGLTARGQVGQRNSAPAVLARRAGVNLPLPNMSGPGFPPPLKIVDDNANGVLDPGEVRRVNHGIGFRRNPDRATRNLAVPGESVRSVTEQIGAGDVTGQFFDGDVDGRDLMKFMILGLPLRDDPTSQIERARELRPSFILVWLGNNDVLDMAIGTRPSEQDLTAAQFGDRYRTMLGRLADTGADMAVVNLPDVTGVAALRRAGDAVTSCRDADGAINPVAPDDLLSIDLDRDLLTQPPCNRVLNATEQARIRSVVVAFNAEIDAAVNQIERNRGITVARIDAFTLFDTIRTTGVPVNADASLVVQTGYLGGFFSLDGIHPTRTGQAIIANGAIDAINARFGETIPRADVTTVAVHDPLVGNRFRPSGEVPFGVIADDDAGDALEGAFRHVKADASDVGEDFADKVRGAFRDLKDLFD